MLIVPGAAGEIGILARHAPLVATLKAGGTRVHIRRDEEIREFATGPGFFKVEQDRALALVDDAVDAREIDPQRAEEQLEEAQTELERIDRGESAGRPLADRAADRHAQNQLDVWGGDPAGGGLPPWRADSPTWRRLRATLSAAGKL